MAFSRDYSYLPPATIQAKLNLWLAADDALANGAQSYTLGNRHLTRADAGEIAQRIEDYMGSLQRCTGQYGPLARAKFSHHQGNGNGGGNY